jgi:ferredoxin-nitrite reductase
MRKDGRTLEGVDIYMGGTVGKDAHLGTCVIKNVPCEDLKPVLRDLLIQHFGAQPKGEDLPESLGSSTILAAVGNGIGI